MIGFQVYFRHSMLSNISFFNGNTIFSFFRMFLNVTSFLADSKVTFLFKM